MIKVKEERNCCGCEACRQICPSQCIAFITDAEGFAYPLADETRCLHCGLCERVCPIVNSNDVQRVSVDTLISYVAYLRREDIRLASSSGGIFSALAECVLQKDGVVYGAAFDDHWALHHVRINDRRDMEALLGSKYLQSRIEDTYQLARNDLDADRQVLFSGTACQIAGLKKYLRREYSNLLTIDVLCHGVPSPRVWQVYLEEMTKRYGASIRRTLFRHKNYGWKEYAMLLEFSNNMAYSCNHNEDAFMQMFLCNISLRPSCYHCRYKEFPRPSDITLGDCWGIENHSPEMDDDKGASVVVANTNRGKEYLDKITDVCAWKQMDLDVILPPTADSRRSVMPHEHRAKFFKVLKGRRCTVKALLRTMKPTLTERVARKLKRVMHLA